MADSKTLTRAQRGAARKESRAAAKGRPAATGTAMFDGSETGEDTVHNVARDQLRALVERIERLEDEKKSIADDIKDVYGEAKANGFDTKALRRLIAIRKQDQNERLEQEAILDTYMAALGMLTPDEGGADMSRLPASPPKKKREPRQKPDDALRTKRAEGVDWGDEA